MAKPVNASLVGGSVSGQPMILLHIVWMARYSGWEPKIYAAGFKIPALIGWGGEMFNFKDESSKCYGHVEIIQRKTKKGYVRPQLHLENLGAKKNAANMSGVLVVWTAPDPRRRGRTVIGWYRNATLFQEMQMPRGKLARQRTYHDQETEEDHIITYRAVADHDDCILVPPDRRTCTIRPRTQRERGRPGQFNAYYPQRRRETGATIEQDIRNFIEGYEKRPDEVATRSKQNRTSQDPSVRKTIEQAAVDLVWDHFEHSEGYEIENCQNDACGYDLRAKRGSEVLCIEVKGRSGSEIAADFTRNEFEKIRLAERRRFADGSYRICIVTKALQSPKLHQFLHWPAAEGVPAGWWTIDGGLPLAFKEVVSARASVLPAERNKRRRR